MQQGDECKPLVKYLQQFLFSSIILFLMHAKVVGF